VAKVLANGRTVIHAGDGQKHVAAPPDVCKTPSPGGPVPVPYPNIASDSDLAKGTKSVKIGGKAVANAGSNLKTSTGDEAGTAGGGLMSSKTKGKMTWGSSSPDVKVEGKGVVRFMDVTQHNGNSFNSVFTSMGGTGLAYADDFQGKCPICRNGPGAHRVMETASSGQLCQRLLDALDKRYKSGGVVGWERTKWRNGFMVGVMVCKHDPPQSFATASGTTPPVFAQVAATIVDHVVSGGPADVEDFINANQSGLPRSRISGALDTAQKLVKEMRANDVTGYNDFGQCAGAKLIARAGHAPLNMTEMFFRADEKTEKPWNRTYSVISNEVMPADAWLRSVLDNALSRPVDRPYRTGMSVASCHSCQTTLYLANCPERTC
jgi:hypothetical protein